MGMGKKTVQASASKKRDQLVLDRNWNQIKGCYAKTMMAYHPPIFQKLIYVLAFLHILRAFLLFQFQRYFSAS
jgi:hypothetical protein